MKHVNKFQASHTNKQGLVAVLCWCGRNIDYLRPKHITAGRTFSCGMTYCGTGNKGQIS